MVNNLLYASKQAYYCEKIKENSYNVKSLFSTINKLLEGMLLEGMLRHSTAYLY